MQSRGHAEPRGERAEALLEAPARAPEVLDDGLAPVHVEGGAAGRERQRVAAEGARHEHLLELAASSSRAADDAASGRPLAMPLPNVARSGTTPKCSCAPPTAQRKPLTISSKIRSAPCRWAAAFTPARKPGAGASSSTGSMITAATLPWCSSSAALERGEVVVVERRDEAREVLRNALRPRGRDRVPLVPAVIAAIEDHVAAGGGAGHAHRRRVGLGAGLHEAHHLGARDDLDEPLGHLDLERMRQREDAPLARAGAPPPR